jgi:hypothetical protein
VPERLLARHNTPIERYNVLDSGVLRRLMSIVTARSASSTCNETADA